MSRLSCSVTIFLVLLMCFIIGQKECGADPDECTENIRVTRLVSRVFYYRCGWHGFWTCRGKRYYKTYSTVEICCDGYEKVNDRCVRKVFVTTRRPRRLTTTTIPTPRPTAAATARTKPATKTAAATTTINTTTTTTTPTKSTEAPTRQTCGVSSFDARKLIVGGTPAIRGEYPWLVSLVSTSHFCGAVIIDSRWVLTAAHCVEFWWKSVYRYIYRVRVGEYDRYVTEDNEVTLAIEKIIAHPDYSEVSVANDIALIKTSKPIVFNEYVKPICLPSANMTLIRNSEVDIAGWGVTDPAVSGLASRVLMEARMRLTSEAVCISIYGYTLVNSHILCVTDGYRDMSKAACNGDSGGPLMLRKDGVTYVIGITSFGSSTGCAGGDPVVYTDVTEYIDWINKVLANN